MIYLLLLVCLPLVALAQASPRSPFDPALFMTYLWVLAIAGLGGFASFYRKVKLGMSRWANLAELVGELTISALTGLITFWLGTAASLNEWVTAAMVAISGHMGSRAFFLFEKAFGTWLERVLDRIFGVTPRQEDKDK